MEKREHVHSVNLCVVSAGMRGIQKLNWGDVWKSGGGKTGKGERSYG